MYISFTLSRPRHKVKRADRTVFELNYHVLPVQKVLILVNASSVRRVYYLIFDILFRYFALRFMNVKLKNILLVEYLHVGSYGQVWHVSV